MSSFDPPLSRTTAALFALGALVVCVWLMYAAHTARTQENAAATAESRRP